MNSLYLLFLQSVGPSVIIQKWQMTACDGDACASAILSRLEEEWEIRSELNYINSVNRKRIDKKIESAYLKLTLSQFASELLNVFDEKRIKKSLNHLFKLGFVKKICDGSEVYYSICPENINAWMGQNTDFKA